VDKELSQGCIQLEPYGGGILVPCSLPVIVKGAGHRVHRDLGMVQPYGCFRMKSPPPDGTHGGRRVRSHRNPGLDQLGILRVLRQMADKSVAQKRKKHAQSENLERKSPATCLLTQSRARTKRPGIEQGRRGLCARLLLGCREHHARRFLPQGGPFNS